MKLLLPLLCVLSVTLALQNELDFMERDLKDLENISEARNLEELEVRGVDFKKFGDKIKDAFNKIKEHLKQGREELSERDLEEFEARGIDFKTFRDKIKDAFNKLKEHLKQGREAHVERDLLTQEETESLKRSLEEADLSEMELRELGLADLSERNIGEKIKGWFQKHFGREVE